MKRKSPLVWVVVSGLIAVAATVGVFMASRIGKHSQARHDVQIIALALDGFMHENGEYPKGTHGEICRMLRGESINGQNPKKLDYIEAQPYEVNASGEFVDPWGEPYRFSIGPKVRVYSCGPNHIDEQGEGDDITSWK
jgi:type II secretory pathway pseudopilin PulG